MPRFNLRNAAIAYLDGKELSERTKSILNENFDLVWHDGEYELTISTEQIQSIVDDTDFTGATIELETLIAEMVASNYDSVCICS